MRQCRPHGAEPDQESRMVLKIERFQPEGMNIRMSSGKPSYSHVVTVSGSGKIVYIAGQLARDIDGNCVGKGDIACPDGTDVQKPRPMPQGGRCDLGRRREDQYLLHRFRRIPEVWRMRYFGVATPTTTVGVTRLAGPDFMIEIEAIAVV